VSAAPTASSWRLLKLLPYENIVFVDTRALDRGAHEETTTSICLA
jgi:hypothetical protein